MTLGGRVLIGRNLGRLGIAANRLNSQEIEGMTNRPNSREIASRWRTPNPRHEGDRQASQKGPQLVSAPVAVKV